MNPLAKPRTAAPLEQVYLIERDPNLLCRILGLYAARGVDVIDARYSYAARDVMKLQVFVADAQAETEELMRVLVAKAESFVGVLAACEQAPGEQLAA